MYCNQCGHKNPDNAKFCSKCGSPIEPITVEEQAVTQPTVDPVEKSHNEPPETPATETTAESTANQLDPAFAAEYMSALEFGEIIHWPEATVIERIKDGQYQGRIKDGVWYVHRSEAGKEHWVEPPETSESEEFIPVSEYAQKIGAHEDAVIQKIRDGELNGRLENEVWVVKLGSSSTSKNKDYAFIESDDLHKWTKIFIYIQIAVAAVAFISSFMELSMLQQMNMGHQFSMSAINANDTRQQMVGWTEFGIFVITAILIAKWIYRANYNARALGAQKMKFTPGWSVGYYFIPILNLWKPYSAMKEIWRASIQPTNYEKLSLPGIVHLWWFLWIVSSLVDNASWRLALRAEKMHEYQMLDYLYMTSSVVLIAGSFVLMNIINQIYQVQQDRKQADLMNPGKS